MRDMNSVPQKKTKKASPSAPFANDYLLWDVSHYNERRELGYKVAREDTIIRHLYIFVAVSLPVMLKMRPGILR